MVTDLPPRSRDIFREIVEAYFRCGEPVGSRTISRRLQNKLSAATIRNVMADLQEEGLLYAPHVSAGRVPTEDGLRLFVNAILELGALSADERETIETQCSTTNKRPFSEILEGASTTLADLTHCVGLVSAPKTEIRIKQIGFHSINSRQVLAIVLTENGQIENRLFNTPFEVTSSMLEVATNYLNAHLLTHRTLHDLHQWVLSEIEQHKAELDSLTTRLIEAGLATCTEDTQTPSQLLFIRGKAKLLDNITALKDIDRIRTLFEILETRDTMSQFLKCVLCADGVQIFIGADNVWFGDVGCSLIVSSYRKSQLIGIVGVLGLQCLNYGKIIPMVDYTAQVISRNLTLQP